MSADVCPWCAGGSQLSNWGPYCSAGCEYSAVLAQARAEGEAAGAARERERVLALVRAAYAAAREVERRCDTIDPSAASATLDLLEQAIERGDHVGATGGAA